MKGELGMEFVDVVDVKQGLAMYRVRESFSKKKFSFKNIFSLLPNGKRLEINFKHL